MHRNNTKTNETNEKVNNSQLFKLTKDNGEYDYEIKSDKTSVLDLDAGNYTLSVTTVTDDNHASKTNTSTIMTYGFNPYLGTWSPYHMAYYSVIESIAKLTAMGGDYTRARLTFQEYFEKLGTNPERWGKPFAALLGAYRVQSELKLGSIGGKDSMSGSFEDLDVPPTLISFAITGADVKDIMTPELKGANHSLVEVTIKKDAYHVFDFEDLKAKYDAIMELMHEGKVFSAYTVKDGGILEAVYKMAFGNEIGVEINEALSLNELLAKNYGHIILEVENDDVVTIEGARVVAHTNETTAVSYKGEAVELDEVYASHTATLESVYPTTQVAPTTEVVVKDCHERPAKPYADKVYDEVKVVIPVFPGTNCDYDTARAFERAGAEVEMTVFKNLTGEDVFASIREMVEHISKCNIMALSGGFSAGDEPDGSAKFIANCLREGHVSEQIMNLL